MKTLACRDFGIDCNFMAHDELTDRLIEKAVRHTRATHPEMLQKREGDMIDRNVRIRMATRIRDRRHYSIRSLS